MREMLPGKFKYPQTTSRYVQQIVIISRGNTSLFDFIIDILCRLFLSVWYGSRLSLIIFTTCNYPQADNQHTLSCWVCWLFFVFIHRKHKIRFVGVLVEFPSGIWTLDPHYIKQESHRTEQRAIKLLHCARYIFLIAIVLYYTFLNLRTYSSENVNLQSILLRDRALC